MTASTRQLLLVLGDQLDLRSSAFADLDPTVDRIWMAETHAEATYVPSHRLRLVAFFSAMRHFRGELEARGWRVEYHALGPDPESDRGRDFAEILELDLDRFRPERVLVVEPGDWRVRRMMEGAVRGRGIPLELRPDQRCLCSTQDFRAWAEGKKSLVLEHFYRWLRKREGILLESDGTPVGGRWNFDEENRETFSREGPPPYKRPRRFTADGITREVIELVSARFADHPGSIDQFDLPVTRKQALALLRDFIDHRLPTFGSHQDAMWQGEPFLSHSKLSFPLNVGLLRPRECVERAVESYVSGHAPLNSVEGFVRQILGWREFVRGIYWLHMPEYLEMNALECDPEHDVPPMYWDGKTDMICVRDLMRGVIDHGYAHHIARLMVLGLFAQLAGVHPRNFHDWHMAMYVDAVDWVSLPNTLGMSQYGDGGIVGSKPYCASGKYIQRMGNHCQDCRYDPARATGDGACPFTTLYWDFLDRHRERFVRNRRMLFQMRNLERKPARQMREIRRAAAELLDVLRSGDRI
jgi:deoxyribodipyrimidine photolyase-related protein